MSLLLSCHLVFGSEDLTRVASLNLQLDLIDSLSELDTFDFVLGWLKHVNLPFDISWHTDNDMPM